MVVAPNRRITDFSSTTKAKGVESISLNIHPWCRRDPQGSAIANIVQITVLQFQSRSRSAQKTTDTVGKFRVAKTDIGIGNILQFRTTFQADWLNSVVIQRALSILQHPTVIGWIKKAHLIKI